MENIRYSDILINLNNSWTIKEKAKYIYNEICKRSSYDERFIYSQNPQLLESIYNRRIDVDNYISPKLICKTLNIIYSELLNRAGIKNKIIKKPSFVNKYIQAEDISLIFYDEENLPYFTSIAADIQRCKYGLKTQFFGGCDENYEEGKKKNVHLIKSDELEAIDRKTGFLSEREPYSDVIFDLISKDVKHNNELKKFLLRSGLHIMVDYLKDQGISDADQFSDNEVKKRIMELKPNDIIKIKMRLANMVPHKDKTSGPIENKKYSIQLLKNGILNKSEQKQYDCFDMLKEDGDQLEILSIIRFNLKPEPIFYLYSEASQQYELLTAEEAFQLTKDYKDKNHHDLLNAPCKHKDITSTSSER